jgi:hypothetical protein
MEAARSRSGMKSFSKKNKAVSGYWQAKERSLDPGCRIPWADERADWRQQKLDARRNRFRKHASTNRGGDQAGKVKPDQGPSPWSWNSKTNVQMPPEDTDAGLLEIGN